jgi:hypothetical protein
VTEKEDKVLSYGIAPKVLALIVSAGVNFFFVDTWIKNPHPTFDQLLSGIFVDLIPIGYSIWLFGSKIKYSSEEVAKVFFSYQRSLMRWDHIKGIKVIKSSRSFILYDNNKQEITITAGQIGIVDFVEHMTKALPQSVSKSLQNEIEEIKLLAKAK